MQTKAEKGAGDSEAVPLGSFADLSAEAGHELLHQQMPLPVSSLGLASFTVDEGLSRPQHSIWGRGRGDSGVLEESENVSRVQCTTMWASGSVALCPLKTHKDEA